MFIKYP